MQTTAKVIHSHFLDPTWSINSLPEEQHRLFKEVAYHVVEHSGFNIFHPLTPNQFIEKLKITDKKEYKIFIEKLAKTYPVQAVDILFDNALLNSEEKSNFFILLLLSQLCSALSLTPQPGDGKISPKLLKSYIQKIDMPEGGLSMLAIRVYGGLVPKELDSIFLQLPENLADIFQKLPLSLFKIRDPKYKENILHELNGSFNGIYDRTINFLAWIPDVQLSDVAQFLRSKKKNPQMKISLFDAWKKFKPAHEGLAIRWLLNLEKPPINQLFSDDLSVKEKNKMLSTLFQTFLSLPADEKGQKKFPELIKEIIDHEPKQENLRQERMHQCIEALVPNADPITYEILSHTLQEMLSPFNSTPRGKAIDGDVLVRWLRLPMRVEDQRLILPLFAAIQGIGTKRVSDKLCEWLFDVCEFAEDFPQFMKKIKEHRLTKYPPAALPLLAIISAFGNANIPLERLQRDIWKDAALRDPVLEILHNLLTTTQLSQEQKQLILTTCWPPEKTGRKAVYTKNDMVAFKDRLHYVQIFLLLQAIPTLLSAVEQKENDLSKTLEECLGSAIQEKFDINHIENFNEKFAQNISNQRDSTALVIYCVQLLSWAENLRKPQIEIDHPIQIGEAVEEVTDPDLSEEDFSVPNSLEDYKRQISHLLKDILEGRFPACRYAIENNDHLSIIASAEPEVYKKWVYDTKSYSIEEWLTEAQLVSKKTPFFNSSELLSNAIRRDHHLGAEYWLEYPLLELYLSGRIHPNALADAFQQKIQHFTMTRSPSLEIILKRLAFEEKLIGYLMQTHVVQIQAKNQPKQMAEQLIPLFNDLFDSAVDYLGEQNTFVGDLQNVQLKLIAIVQQHAFDPSRYKDWIVKRTDDWMDLLLVGTEVPGSCQDIHGDPEVNRCLFSYIQDGKNQAFVLIDDKGRIQSRCIGRLLLLNGITPVLFKEKNYQRPIPQELNPLLDEFFLQTAEELGVQLLEFFPGSIAEGDGFLESKGGPAPWEYVDALGNRGVKNSPSFKIPLENCRILYDP